MANNSIKSDFTRLCFMKSAFEASCNQKVICMRNGSQLMFVVSHMKRISKILIGVLLVMTTPTNAEEEKGIIGRVYEDGLPVIYKFVNELPSEDIRNHLTWLTVISWKYDGKSNNGMPQTEENQKMIIMEGAIEDHIENDKVLRHVYSRTGNNLKELVYYIHDQQQFLESFNNTLTNHPRYPIEINFYEDKEWEDFQRLLNDFNKNG